MEVIWLSTRSGKELYEFKDKFSQLGKHDMRVSLNSSTKVGLFEFKLKIWMNEVLDEIYCQPIGQI